MDSTHIKSSQSYNNKHKESILAASMFSCFNLMDIPKEVIFHFLNSSHIRSKSWIYWNPWQNSDLLQKNQDFTLAYIAGLLERPPKKQWEKGRSVKKCDCRHPSATMAEGLYGIFRSVFQDHHIYLWVNKPVLMQVFITNACCFLAWKKLNFNQKHTLIVNGILEHIIISRFTCWISQHSI